MSLLGVWARLFISVMHFYILIPGFLPRVQAPGCCHSPGVKGSVACLWLWISAHMLCVYHSPLSWPGPMCVFAPQGAPGPWLAPHSHMQPPQLVKELDLVWSWGLCLCPPGAPPSAWVPMLPGGPQSFPRHSAGPQQSRRIDPVSPSFKVRENTP